jgi:hypothetical protein
MHSQMMDLRASVRGAATNKDLRDYESILNTCDDMRDSFAAGDIFSSKLVPFLKVDGDSSVSANGWLQGLSLHQENGKLVLTKPEPTRKLSLQQRTKQENRKLTRAFDLLTQVRTSPDATTIFFEVATVFEELGM